MKMKHWMAGIVALLVFVSPGVAQDHGWVSSFLNRYRPAANDASQGLVPQTNVPALRAQIQNGTLPITVDALVRLLLSSSLDVTAYRFSPLVNQFAVGLAYQPFEPFFFISSNVSRVSQPSTTQLNGAAVASTLSGNYQLGVQELLPTGTSYSATIGISRSSSNSVFNTFNPYYSG